MAVWLKRNIIIHLVSKSVNKPPPSKDCSRLHKTFNTVRLKRFFLMANTSESKLLKSNPHYQWYTSVKMEDKLNSEYIQSIRVGLLTPSLSFFCAFS